MSAFILLCILNSTPAIDAMQLAVDQDTYESVWGSA